MVGELPDLPHESAVQSIRLLIVEPRAINTLEAIRNFQKLSFDRAKCCLHCAEDDMALI